MRGCKSTAKLPIEFLVNTLFLFHKKSTLSFIMLRAFLDLHLYSALYYFKVISMCNILVYVTQTRRAMRDSKNNLSNDRKAKFKLVK